MNLYSIIKVEEHEFWCVPEIPVTAAGVLIKTSLGFSVFIRVIGMTVPFLKGGFED